MAAKATIILGCLVSHSHATCNFAVGQLQFDLCPLLNTSPHLAVGEETPPTYTTHNYAFSFIADIPHDGTLPADLQCPEGTRICLTVVNTRLNHPSEPSRITQVVPIARSNGLDPIPALAAKAHPEDAHAPLQLTFHGGIYTQHRQKATFFFHCDPSVEHPSKPTFLYTFNGTHAFSWSSKHACHKALPDPVPPSDPEPDPDPPQNPPKDPDSELEVDKPLPKPQNSTITLILWLALPSIFLVRFVYSRSRKHSQYLPLPLPVSMKLMFNRIVRDFPPRRMRASKGHDVVYDTGETRYGGYGYYHVEGEEVPLMPNLGGGVRGDETRDTTGYGSFVNASRETP